MRSDWRVHVACGLMLVGFFGVTTRGVLSPTPLSPEEAAAMHREVMRPIDPSVPLHRAYVAGTQPFTLRSATTGKGVSLACPSRDYLAGYLEASIGARVFDGPLLTVAQKCGAVYGFETIRDLPKRTLPCRCRDRACVVIQYTGSGSR